jgi:uncharacterized membrane protein
LEGLGGGLKAFVEGIWEKLVEELGKAIANGSFQVIAPNPGVVDAVE